MNFNLKNEVFLAIDSVNLNEVSEISKRLMNKINLGGKIVVCGNGGSLSDGAHFVGELLGRYKKTESKSLPAIILTTGDAAGSAISNDYGYQFVFSRQIEGLCSKKDFLICISTSGQSQNIINAINVATKMEIDTFFLTSKKFFQERQNPYLTILKIESEYTPAIQQAQMFVMHQICEFLEEYR